MTKPIDVTDQTFDVEVLQSDKPVLVDFWAPWCGPCRALGKVIEEIATEREGDLKVVKVNIDESSQYAMKLGVMSVPTMVLFMGGNPVEKVVGAYPKQGLLSRLDPHLTPVS